MLCLFGCPGEPEGLLRPNGVFVTREGRIFVMDNGHNRVAEVDSSGKVLRSFGSARAGESQIGKGWDLDYDPVSRQLVFAHHILSPEGNHIVQDGIRMVSLQDGHFFDVGRKEYSGQGDNPSKPMGVNWDSANHLWVTDLKTRTIRIFARKEDKTMEEMNLFFQFESHDFIDPQDVVADGLEGVAFIAESAGQRLSRIEFLDTGSGISLRSRKIIGKWGDKPGQFSYPFFMAYDDLKKRLYVGDLGNLRVQVLNIDGEYIEEFAPPVRIWEPMGMSVGPGGDLYIADSFNNCIWKREFQSGKFLKIGGTP